MKETRNISGLDDKKRWGIMIKVALCSVIAVLLMASLSFAQSTAIQAGLNNLTSTQNSDGSWGGDLSHTEILPSTGAVIRTLQLLNQTNTESYSEAIQWYQGQNLGYTENISERSHLLNIGNDVDLLSSYFDQLTYAWGGYDDQTYRVNNLDTALALQALKAVNYPSQNVISSALFFLTSTQNTDGGWGFCAAASAGCSDSGSNIYMTAMVLNTLSQFKSTYELRTPRNKAVAYLLTKQNPDGGFGSSRSMVYETSLAFEALIASGANISAVAPSSVNYLLTTQLPDGSWEEDPYSTALALRALAAVKPNLSISAADITCSNPTPTAGDTITIAAIVHNDGPAPADNLSVRFYDGDPTEGGLLIGETTMLSIPANGNSQTSISWTTPNASTHTIFVKIDPSNVIDELNETDNTASKNLASATLPDLSITSADITFSPPTPMPADAVIITATVRNLGETGATNVTVDLYDGDPSGGGILVGNTAVPSLGAGNSTAVQLPTNFTAGSHTVYVILDRANYVAEGNEANNTTTKTVQVGGGLIDLSVAGSDMTFSPEYPVEGNLVNINAAVHNLGEGDAKNILVRFYLGDPDAGGTKIGGDITIPSLLAGSTIPISTTWNSTGKKGNNTIFVKADPLDAIAESNEANNKAFISIKIAATDGPNLMVSYGEISFSPISPVSGDVVTISAVIRNNAYQTVNNVVVEFSDGDPDVGGTRIIGQRVITSLAGGAYGSTAVRIDWNTTGLSGIHEIYVSVDPFNEIVETDEKDNIAHATLGIMAMQGPDVAITALDVSGLVTDTQTLKISGIIRATLLNKGNQPTALPFEVAAFEDRNNNRRLDIGADNILGKVICATSLLAGSTDAVEIPVSGDVLFRDNIIYVMADSSNSPTKIDETNNIRGTDEACGNKPECGPFEVREKFAWTGSTIFPALKDVYNVPIVANLTDDNRDGLINEADIPDIIFHTSSIRAISGNDGHELFTVTNTDYFLHQYSHIAVADIDNDGLVEILGFSNRWQPVVVAFKHDGSVKWVSQPIWMPTGYFERWGVSVADIDGDGKPEIISGPNVLDNDGTLRWSVPVNDGLPLVADLDMDGDPEILIGNTAYRNDGTVYWTNDIIKTANVAHAVANLDDDPYPEIVQVVGSTYFVTVYVFNHDGTLKWGPVRINSGGFSAAPTIADFDGDGRPEIGISSGHRYTVLRSDGSVMWQSVVEDGTMGGLSATAFDFDNDGAAEIVYNDMQYLRIYDGKNGRSPLSPHRIRPATIYEYPVVADVDNDGSAEIVVYANYGYTYNFKGIRVFENQCDNWPNTRKIWNEYNYHISNVNDDGTIPMVEQNNWEIYNNYRQQPVLPGKAWSKPDISTSYIVLDQTNYPNSVSISARIGNGGAIGLKTGVDVTFYDGDPSQGGLLIGTVHTSRILDPGDYEDISITWNNPSSGSHTIYVIADKDNKFNECREDNNQASAVIAIGVTTPPVYLSDLSITQTDITIVPPDPVEGQNAAIGAVIYNDGNADAFNIAVAFYDGDASTGTLIGTLNIPFIQSGGTSYVQMQWNTYGQSGRNYIHVIADPQNLVSESNEDNNASLTSVDVIEPTKPDLTITTTDILLSNQTPKEGDPLMITATIHNLGISAGSIKIDLYDGGIFLNTQTVYQIILFGGQAQVTFPIDTVGFSGNHSFSVIVDPQNTIDEQREDNNNASSNLLIGTIGLNLTATTDNSQYQENEDVRITGNLKNIQSETRNLLIDIKVFDSAGFLTASLNQQPLTLNPLETKTVSFLWNTGNTLIGGYTIRITVYDAASHPLAKQSVPIGIISSQGISTDLVLDKISYYPNDVAKITSAITNNSLNKIYENLTATVTVKTPSSLILFTEDSAIGILIPLSYYSFNTYWNTGIDSPGEYPVTLDIKDASGNVLSTSTKNLTITNNIKPSKFLKGTISVDKQNILRGEPLNIAYSVTNVGNMDLPAVNLSILTVHIVELTTYDTLIDQTSLMMGGTYANTKQLNTQNYSAKDYLVILRANVSGVEETLAGTYFRVEGAPSAPSLSVPAHGDDVETYTPILIVNNASDPNNDNLTYEFELYADSGLTNLIAAADTISEGQNITSWQVPANLQENAVYYWRAKAYDELLYGEWMLPASFRVNVVNDPPTTPTLSSPADNSEVDTLTPILTVNNASDPDSSNLTYNFELSLDRDFSQIIASQIGIFESVGTTSWQVPVTLNENTTYYWRAQADDWLIEGPWMTPAKFFVNTANDAPTAPSVIIPSNNSEITTPYADITVSNSIDPDSADLVYIFEIDTSMTFDSSNLIRSGNIPQGQGATIGHREGLTDNTYYYVRAKATDGLAESPWSEVVRFFVNTTNDAPTTPVLSNPSDGAGVNAFSPTLSVHNSEDIDGDDLTYEFEVYSDSAMTNLVANVTGIAATSQITSWTVSVNLAENNIYYWRTRAFDGELYSNWMPLASFMINSANDAPDSPQLHSPAEGNSLDTLNPTLSVNNATDPDSDGLTYDFEVYSGGTLIQSITGVPQGISGITSATLNAALSDNTTYIWRARAYDGDRYGAWMDMAIFSIHLPVQNITATIDFDPDTLNQKSNGKWVTVHIELPTEYDVHNINISSIRLNGTIPAEAWPYCIGDDDHDGIRDLMVKFKRVDVINILPNGDNILVTVTGTVGAVTFEGVDVIRVIH